MINILLIDNLKENEDKIKDILIKIDNTINLYFVNETNDIYNYLNNEIIDIILIEYNKLNICINIRNNKDYENIPIIGFNIPDNDKILLSKFNIDLCLTKSLDIDLLKQFINITIRIKKNEEKIKKEKQTLEKVLIDSENRYRELFKNVHKINKELDQILNVTSPLCVINNDKKIILVNDSYCKLFKKDINDVQGKSCYDVIGSKLCKDSCPLKKITTKNSKYTFECTTKIEKDKYINCLVTSKPYENDNNEIIGIVQTYTDITKIKKIEKKLIYAKQKAEESDKLKSSFLANMSHEIRTPMNSIIGFSDLLSEDYIDKDTKESYLNIIQNAGNDLLKLIDDIIDIAKMESGQMKLKLESISIDKLLFEIYLILNEHPNLKANNVKLNLIKNKKQFKDTILTDGLRLKQILINLLNNAIKFTHQGKIDFGYNKVDSFLEFFVKDTGIGLTKEQIKIIFDRFRQADDSTTKKYGGNGLGLSISKGLIKMLGGTINVESKLGEGTTFKFTIPYNETNNIIYQKTDVVYKKFNWNSYTFLVAEDVDINYQLLYEILKNTKVEIIRAKNGQELIELFKKNKNNIDLILMDIQMPIINGYDAIKKIKKIKNVPIIVQTAYAMIEDIKKCFECGCDDYISKPLKKDKLLNLINKHIKK
jgi:PAS domain S-box-containing protein